MRGDLRAVAVLVLLVLAAVAVSIPRDREWGLLLAHSGRAQGAPLLAAALAANPDDRVAMAALVTVLSGAHDGDPAQVRAVLTAWVKRHRDDADARAQLVATLVAMNDSDAAVAVLCAAPPSPTLTRQLAQMYADLGDLAQAEATLATLMDGSARDLPLLRTISAWQRQRGNAPDLLSSLERLSTLDEPAARRAASLELITLHRRQGHDDAAVAYARTLEPDPALDAAALRLLIAAAIDGDDLALAKRVGARLLTRADSSAADALTQADVQGWTHHEAELLTTLTQAQTRFPDDERLLRRLANAFFAARQGDQALRWSRLLAARTATEVDARSVAQLCLDLARPAEARAALAGFIASGQAAPSTRFLDGVGAARVGDEAAATARLSELVVAAQANDGSPREALLAAELAGVIGNAGVRVRMLERALTYAPTTPQTSLDLARAYLDLGRPAQALALLDALNERSGIDSVDLRRERARACAALTGTLRADDPALPAARARAVAALTAALADASTRAREPGLFADLIRLHLERGDHDAAQALLSQLGDDESLRLAVALALANAGRAERALALVAAFNDDRPHGQLAALASIQLLAGDVAGAQRRYEQASALAPTVDAYVVALADVHGARRDYARQYALLESRLTRGESAWLDLADRQLWNAEPTRELETLTRARAAIGDSPALVQRQLIALENLGQHRAVVTLWRAHPTAFANADVDVVAAAGLAFAALGDEASAQALLRRALATGTDSVAAKKGTLLTLARLCARTGRSREAVSLYRRHLAARPQDGWAWYDLGEMLAAGGIDAQREFREAERLLPSSDDVRVLAARANCARRLGDLPRAVALYRRAVAPRAGKASGDQEAACDFALLLIELHRPDDALTVLRGAQTNPESPRFSRTRALSLYSVGDADGALRLLRQLHAADPSDAGVTADLASITDGAGNWLEAVWLYRQVSQR